MKGIVDGKFVDPLQAEPPVEMILIPDSVTEQEWEEALLAAGGCTYAVAKHHIPGVMFVGMWERDTTIHDYDVEIGIEVFCVFPNGEEDSREYKVWAGEMRLFGEQDNFKHRCPYETGNAMLQKILRSIEEDGKFPSEEAVEQAANDETRWGPTPR